MEEQTSKPQGWLGGLKVPFNFNALILCFAAVVIFKVGVWSIELFTPGGHVFERVVQKLDDAVEDNEHPYLQWAIEVLSPLEQRQAAAIRMKAELDAVDRNENLTTTKRELRERITQLRAESETDPASAAAADSLAVMLLQLDQPEGQGDFAAMLATAQADGRALSLPRDAMNALRSKEIPAVTWVLFALLVAVLWSFLAAAVCRISAMHLARDQGLELKEALMFAQKKGLKILLCLAIPAALILILWGLNSLFGLLMNVMILDILLSVLFVLVFLSSFFIVFVMFLSLFGFNLMGSAVATESSDVFDGISRAWDYLTSCPWHAVVYYFTVAAYLIIIAIGAQLFIDFSLCTLSNQFYGLNDTTGTTEIEKDGVAVEVKKPSSKSVFEGVVLGKSDDLYKRVGYVDGEWVFYQGGEDRSDAIGSTTIISAYILWFWVAVAKLLVLAYLLHYWLSANTTIYFLLRKEVDEDDFNQIYLEDEENLDSLGDDESFKKVLEAGATTETEKLPAAPAAKDKADGEAKEEGDGKAAAEADEKEDAAADEGESEDADEEEDAADETEEEGEESDDDEESPDEQAEEEAEKKDSAKEEPAKEEPAADSKGKKKKKGKGKRNR